MAAVWTLREASVEDVRSQLSRPDLAYTTVHTVLNRLVHRGLIQRVTQDGGQVYRPRLDEAEHIARAFDERLGATSPSVREEALKNLVDRLDDSELGSIAAYADRIKRQRSSG